MLNKSLEINAPTAGGVPVEGDLYKTVTVFGHTFELRYGYYSDTDRHTEPVVIYPDFTKEPLYTENNEPFVTVLQDACECFKIKGRGKRTEDSTCSECIYFTQGEEWFGVCKCQSNKKNE